MSIPTVAVGIVGFGSIAKSHLSALKALPVVRDLSFRPVVSVVVSERAELLHRDVASLGVTRMVSSLEEALADPELTLIDVTSRNDSHAASARAALEARRALYLEKPIGRTAEEARALSAMAAAMPRPSQAGLVLRYEPAVVTARALLRQGAIGAPRHGRMASFHGSYLDPARPISWRLRSATAGGGAMLDLGLHLIDAARFLLGDARLVASSARTIVPQRPTEDGGSAAVDVDDWAWAELEFGDELRVTIEASRISYGAEGMPFELYGTEGSLVGDLRSGQLALNRFDGAEQDYRRRAATDRFVQAVEALRPPSRLSLGSFVDLHAAALHHACRRAIGDDPAPGLAPTLADSAAAELLAHAIAAHTQSIGVIR
jgi:predicted dehydrogenase